MRAHSDDGQSEFVSSDPVGARGPVELAVIIPTLEELENIEPLIARLDAALEEIVWEAIFVDDDSRDGTAQRVREISLLRPSIRVLQRIGRRGLTSACMEGIMATAAPYVAIMDADLQHDETLLPRMLGLLRHGNLDLVVASRNTGEGSMGQFAVARVKLSSAGKMLSRAIVRTDLTDPMSGFFMADRRFVERVIRRMSGVSFKILVDMVSSSREPVHFAEVPYSFRDRLHGQCKLDPNTLFEFGILITHKAIHGILPPRFVLFSVVGTAGLVLHLGVLAATLQTGSLEFSQSQIVATLVAMGSNFLLNNVFTFRDRRLKGMRLLMGAVTFFLCCAVGGFASLVVGERLYAVGVAWYLAGAVGTIVAAVWNFGVSSTVTWPERR